MRLRNTVLIDKVCQLAFLKELCRKKGTLELFCPRFARWRSRGTYVDCEPGREGFWKRQLGGWNGLFGGVRLRPISRSTNNDKQGIVNFCLSLDIDGVCWKNNFLEKVKKVSLIVNIPESRRICCNRGEGRDERGQLVSPVQYALQQVKRHGYYPLTPCSNTFKNHG
ncbi:hypothetical protein BDZ91DRAFT_308695 [Kalaharituber pfeilii]|nr:hypothetical protein BDZ91DRAFT_308695 [Kalaharituber pfeilii]